MYASVTAYLQLGKKLLTRFSARESLKNNIEQVNLKKENLLLAFKEKLNFTQTQELKTHQQNERREQCQIWCIHKTSKRTTTQKDREKVIKSVIF